MFGLIVVCTTASAAEMGRNFKEENTTRHITADGASKDADTSRKLDRYDMANNPEKYYTADRVSLGAARSRPWARRMQL